MGTHGGDEIAVHLRRQVFGVEGAVQAGGIAARPGVIPIAVQRAGQRCRQGALDVEEALMQREERVAPIASILRIHCLDEGRRGDLLVPVVGIFHRAPAQLRIAQQTKGVG